MSPVHASLAKLERAIDDALRRGDLVAVEHLRAERADLRLMLVVDGVASWLRVSA